MPAQQEYQYSHEDMATKGPPSSFWSGLICPAAEQHPYDEQEPEQHTDWHSVSPLGCELCFRR